MSGSLHADANAGFEKLYEPNPTTGRASLPPVACWAHARAVKSLTNIHRPGRFSRSRGWKRSARCSPSRGPRSGAARQAQSVHLLADLKASLETCLNRISGKSDLAKAIRYGLNRGRCSAASPRTGALR
ncbi:MAG: transposase [Pseudomonadota bacterium]|nr:transposase [Pseudomonadota bacterium]